MWDGSRATDKYSGTSYEHRRAWVEDKVLWLSSVFAMGICAYALISNHVHLVLCVARKYLDEQDASGRVTLMITGGLRVPIDFVKALALDADACRWCRRIKQCYAGYRLCSHKNV
jgi:hypothetical protein